MHCLETHAFSCAKCAVRRPLYKVGLCVTSVRFGPRRDKNFENDRSVACRTRGELEKDKIGTEVIFGVLTSVLMRIQFC
jgi:hypothetical protein